MAIVSLVMPGKVNILKSHHEKLGSELDMKSFDGSWTEKVSNSLNIFKHLSWI